MKLNLPVELDFLREADNNRRCAANLAAADSGVRGRVTVPAVDPALTTPCVLTMEFIDGVPVTDTAGLAALGAQPRVRELSLHYPACISQLNYRVRILLR